MTNEKFEVGDEVILVYGGNARGCRYNKRKITRVTATMVVTEATNITGEKYEEKFRHTGYPVGCRIYDVTRITKEPDAFAAYKREREENFIRLVAQSLSKLPDSIVSKIHKFLHNIETLGLIRKEEKEEPE